MKKLTAFLAFIVLVSFQLLQAQQMQVTGTVTSAEDDSPIPGVSVVVKGTTRGTITSSDGTYSINVSDGNQTLVFSFVGMRTIEVPIEGRSTIDVVLEYESVGLDEVMVTAYGLETMQSKTGALSVVKSDEMQDVPVPSFEKAIQGRVAGVQINNPSGAPGAKSSITIRGVSSINAETDPLWVVDGVPIAHP